MRKSPRFAPKKPRFGGCRRYLRCVRMCWRIRVNLSEVPEELKGEKTG